MAITNAILSDKAPFLVTVLFAAAGWVVTYSVDQIVKTPSIEYSTTSKAGLLTIDIHNITRTTLFKGPVFTATSAQDQMLKGWIHPVPPAWEGNTKVDVQGHTVNFTIDQFQPEWRFKLVTQYSGNDIPRFYMSSASDPVRLVESGLETFFVNHELSILFLTVGIWIVAAGSLLHFAPRSDAETSHDFPELSHEPDEDA